MGQGVNLTMSPFLPRLRMLGAVPLFYHMLLWHDASLNAGQFYCTFSGGVFLLEAVNVCFHGYLGS